MSEIQFLIGQRPMRSYSPGALATVALWKSAPMLHLLPSVVDRKILFTASGRENKKNGNNN